MRHFTLATGSAAKLKEYRALLSGIELDAKKLEIDEIQSLDLEEIARKKARAAYEQLRSPVIVDDTGFYLDAWKGLPGPFFKFFEDAFGIEAPIRLLHGHEDRGATARSCIAYCDGQTEFVVSGEVRGTIARELRGPEGAFGFDYCFIPEGHEQTFAEMGLESKEKISHRGNALRAFVKKLKDLP
jgi:XTP/dITP diphosphohydrolase